MGKKKAVGGKRRAVRAPEGVCRIGVDVGGSKILAAVFDAEGRLIGQEKRKTKPEKGYVGVCERIAEAAREAVQAAGRTWKDVASVGVGVPGPVTADGRLVAAPGLGWGGEDIRSDLAELLDGRPLAVGNDVNYGALGEVAQGSAQGLDPVVALFVGTGLGGALLVGGRVVQGRHGLAGEIGHLPTPFSEAECACGQIGCLETVASKRGIARLVADMIADGDTCLLSDPRDIKAGDLRQAWDRDCEVVQAVMRRVAQGLAWGVVAATAVVDPQAVVFGGGVMEAVGDRLLPMVQKALGRYCFFADHVAFDLRLASLGDLAVATGAAAAGAQAAADGAAS